MKPCGSSKRSRHFGGTYRLHLQGNKTLEIFQLAYSCTSNWCGCERFSSPSVLRYILTAIWENLEDGRGCVCPKRRFLLEPYGVISQKTTAVIVTAVKNHPRRQWSSNLQVSLSFMLSTSKINIPVPPNTTHY
jgi:hypothetical protein